MLSTTGHHGAAPGYETELDKKVSATSFRSALSREQEHQVDELYGAVEADLQVRRSSDGPLSADREVRGPKPNVSQAHETDTAYLQGQPDLKAWCTRTTLKRYLVARQWDLTAAAKMLRATFEWCVHMPSTTFADLTASLPTVCCLINLLQPALHRLYPVCTVCRAFGPSTPHRSQCTGGEATARTTSPGRTLRRRPSQASSTSAAGRTGMAGL